MPGFYIPELKKTDKEIEISGNEHHHIVHVRRLQSGDKITLTNGSGVLAEAEITSISRKTVSARILKLDEIAQSTPRIAAAFSLLKSKNDHIIIEKLTELGVKEFFPLITERSVRNVSTKTVKKFTSIAISAIKQCDNAHLPLIHEPIELQKALEQIKEAGFTPVIAVECGERAGLNKILTNLGVKNPCLVIGPEGGFSQQEIEYFNEMDIFKITLGNHILRAETAAIASIAQTVNFYLEQNGEYY